MLSWVNGVVWMEDGSGAGGDAAATPWPRPNPGCSDGAAEAKDEVGLTSFRFLLKDDWYIGGTGTTDPGPFFHEGFDALPTHHNLKGVAFSSNTSSAEALLSTSRAPELLAGQHRATKSLAGQHRAPGDPFHFPFYIFGLLILHSVTIPPPPFVHVFCSILTLSSARATARVMSRSSPPLSPSSIPFFSIPSSNF